MTDMFSLAGVALCSLCAVLTVREVRRDFTPYLLMGTAVLLLLACLPGIGEGVRFAGTLTAAAGEGTVSVVLRALGVAWMTSAAGEICRGAGEGQLASWLETAGRVELLVLSLPLLRELLALAGIGP